MSSVIAGFNEINGIAPKLTTEELTGLNKQVGVDKKEPKDVAGAWLNGQVRPWGFSLDGRVQQDARRGYDFKLDADVRDWLRTVRRWMLETPSPGERL